MVPKGSPVNCTPLSHPDFLVSFYYLSQKKFPGTHLDASARKNDILTSVMTPMPGHGNQITECAHGNFSHF